MDALGIFPAPFSNQTQESPSEKRLWLYGLVGFVKWVGLCWHTVCVGLLEGIVPTGCAKVKNKSSGSDMKRGRLDALATSVLKTPCQWNKTDLKLPDRVARLPG